MSQREPDFPVTLLVAKRGDLRWLGHLDFAHAVARALRRSGLVLRHSEGYHPRPKLRLPEPLPLGVGSAGERFVAALLAPAAIGDVARAVAPQLPAGLPLIALRDGSHPEERAAPFALALRSEDPGSLGALLDRVLAADGALAGGATVLAAGPPVVVRLVAPPGERASAGRFLATLKPLAATAGCPLLEVDRVLAADAVEAPPWLVLGGALQSPTPFSAPVPTAVVPVDPRSERGRAESDDSPAARSN